MGFSINSYTLCMSTKKSFCLKELGGEVRNFIIKKNQNSFIYTQDLGISF